MRKMIKISLILLLLLTFTLPVSTQAESSTSVKDDIIYDIIVDRYNNGSHAPSDQRDIDNPLTYNGGDIKGIIQMLDKIEEHGFTAISLSSIMANASKGYHGYWIEDFYEVEEEFGSMDDLRELVDAAHERNMKVYLEFVTNYAHQSSPLVSEHSNWFKEVEATPIPATEWLKEVKQFNHEIDEVQQFFFDVADYWIEESGIDGYILHAADQALATFIENLTKHIKDHHVNFVVIANTLQGDSVNHLCDIAELDAIANVELMEVIQHVFSHVDEPVSQLYEVTKNANCDKMLLFADTKNTPRFSYLFKSEGRNEFTIWSLTLAYLYFSPGVPIIYQGSEVPMYGPKFPENQLMYDPISADPDMQKLFNRFASAREMFPALVHGDFEQIAVNEGFSLFKRTFEGETVYFAINNDSESRVVELEVSDENLQLRGLFHDDTIRANDGKYYVGLTREAAEIFVLEENAGINWTYITMLVGIMAIFVIAIVILSIKQKKRQKE